VELLKQVGQMDHVGLTDPMVQMEVREVLGIKNCLENNKNLLISHSEYYILVTI